MNVSSDIPHIYLFRRISDNSPVYVGQHNGKNPHYVTGGTVLKQELSRLRWNGFWKIYVKEIVKEIVEECSVEDINTLEILYIEEFNTFNGNNSSAYNLNIGGVTRGRYRHTEESKQKLSLALKGRVLGPPTEEHKEKNRIAHTGVNNSRFGCRHTDETKKKMSIKARARPKRSKEWSDRISATRKGKADITCPHCNKTGGWAGMLVHHFNNCKFKVNND